MTWPLAITTFHGVSPLAEFRSHVSHDAVRAVSLNLMSLQGFLKAAPALAAPALASKSDVVLLVIYIRVQNITHAPVKTCK